MASLFYYFVHTLVVEKCGKEQNSLYQLQTLVDVETEYTTSENLSP